MGFEEISKACFIHDVASNNLEFIGRNIRAVRRDSGMTLAELAASPRLADQCDKATVFRLLQRLVGHGIVRRLGLHERAAYFTLLLPGRHCDYLICTGCGSIEAITAPCPVHELEEEIRHKTGFRNLYHELEFFGLCPRCP